MKHGWLPRIFSTLLAFTFVLSAVADEPAYADGLADGDLDVTRLEALLTAQQQKIDALQRQVGAANAQDTDAARVEAMKQQIRDVLGEQEFRESLMPSMLQAGYDDGFFIRSSDDKFSMTFNGLMQFRWTHYGTRARNRYLLPRFERDDRTGFDMQRLRLIISGHAYSEDLTYHIHLTSDAPAGYDTGILWSWVNYRFCDEFQMTAGLFCLPATRWSWLDEGQYQFVDRSMTDWVFQLGDGVGVMFWGQLFEKKLDYYLAVANSLNGPGNRTITTDPAELDGNPAITFRAVWHALGDDPDVAISEGDLAISESPVLDLGFHYAFNEDAGDLNTTVVPFRRRSVLPGGFGVTTTNGLQINQFGLEAAFRVQGFSATAEYMLRLLDVRHAGRAPFTPLWLLTGDDSTNAQHGAYLQCGYFLPIPGMEKKLEAVARVGGISALSGGQEGAWEYAAGLNYYFEGHKVKLQTDVTKTYEAPISNSYGSLANVNDDALTWRVQLQVAF